MLSKRSLFAYSSRRTLNASKAQKGLLDWLSPCLRKRERQGQAAQEVLSRIAAFPRAGWLANEVLARDYVPGLRHNRRELGPGNITQVALRRRHCHLEE